MHTSAGIIQLVLPFTLLYGALIMPTETHSADTFPAVLELVVAPEPCDTKCEIRWASSEIAAETISLYYDADNQGLDGTLIVADIPVIPENSSYFWNVANLPEGNYHIYAGFKQGTETGYSYSDKPVSVAHNTGCLEVESRPNLLPNPGFETGAQEVADWIVIRPYNRDRNWQYGWVDDSQIAHTGNRSIQLANTFNGVNSSSAWEDRVIISSPLLDLPTGKDAYLLTGWVKTAQVGFGQALFRIKYYDENGQQLSIKGLREETFYTGGPQTEEWTRVAFFLDPPHWNSPPYPSPARAYKIRVNFSLDNSPGKLWVDDVSLVAISKEEYEQFLPGNRYRPPAIKQAAAPETFPSVEGWGATIQKNPSTGVWWIVGRDKTAFWATGSQVDSNDKLLSATGLSSSAYKKEAQYRAKTDLNFNQGWRDKSGSGQYSTTRRYINWLNFSSEPTISASPDQWVLKDREGSLIAGYGHYFPDVFSPIWQEHANREANTLLDDGGWKLSSEDIIGYWTDNEWAYGDLHDFFWGDTCRLAFVDWIQGKNDLPSVNAKFQAYGSSIRLKVPAGVSIAAPYTSVADLNRAWSSGYHTYNYGSFNDITATDKPYIRAHDDPVRHDLYAFERVVYTIYVNTIIDNIRNVESAFMESNSQGVHQPIFSNRFHLTSPAAMAALQRNMDIFSRFDVIAVNWYPRNQTKTYNSLEWMEIVKATFHDTTGRPLYISEFGMAAEDADDYSSQPYMTIARWREMTVKNQFQRGWAYENFISTWINLPYILGANWYKWSNGYGNPAGSDVRNCGIVNDNDKYYSQFANTIRSVNKQVNSVERQDSLTINDIDWANIAPWICGASGRISPPRDFRREE